MKRVGNSTGLKVLTLALVALFAVAGVARAADPNCLDNNGSTLEVINQTVLKWKQSTPNQFLARALVRGQVTQVFNDHSGHDHFEISLGDGAKDVLEVIYNQEFGELPEIQKGMMVTACGDYITSTQATDKYPASPSGAIIHWVHYNPKGKGHKDGFVSVDGRLFGVGNKPVRPGTGFVPSLFADGETFEAALR